MDHVEWKKISINAYLLAWTGVTRETEIIDQRWSISSGGVNVTNKNTHQIFKISD